VFPHRIYRVFPEYKGLQSNHGRIFNFQSLADKKKSNEIKNLHFDEKDLSISVGLSSLYHLWYENSICLASTFYF
jgi:hypothetical protein